MLKIRMTKRMKTVDEKIKEIEDTWPRGPEHCPAYIDELHDKLSNLWWRCRQVDIWI